jgi:diguanylate cyclase (GGDEF)-like protein/PAS domain S-box-containing protein
MIAAPLFRIDQNVARMRPLKLCKYHLFRLVLPFVAVILFQALLASLSLEILSSVRAYIGAESLWSKNEKNAIYSLLRYSRSGDEQYLYKFRSAIAIPLADHAARIALEKEIPDLDAAYKSFIEGGNHPGDISGMIRLFRYFRNVPYIARAIDEWRSTDPLLDQLTSLADTMHREFSGVTDVAEYIKARKEQIDLVERQFAPFLLAMGQNDATFDESLGQGQRSLEFLLTVVNILTANLLILLLVFHTNKIVKQRLAFENELMAEKERAEVTLASLGEAVISTDAGGRLKYMNPAAERLIGCTSAQAQSSPLSSLFSIVDEVTETANDRLIDQSLCEGVAIDRQRLVRPDTSSVAVSIVGAPLHADGEVAGAVLVLLDMTREREFIARLSWQASHDALTGLANRREFESRLKHTLEQLSHQRGEHSLMFLDIDQFKVVNDTCGHAAGDQLLRQISGLLQENVGADALLARLGGDEFGVLVRNCDAKSATQIADRLRLTVQELNFVWSGCVFNASVSIGLVHISQEDTVEETLKAADVACYMAKEKGRNRVQAYHPSDSELAQRVQEMAWVQRIRNGLEQQRFCLFAQEIRTLKGSEPDHSRVELLIRLRDEDGNLVPPGSFLPAAERYGLMPLIDRWVVKTAFGLLASRLHSPGSACPASCAINLSGVTFGDDDFIDYVRRQFEIHRIPPQMICFEVTETSAISNLSSAKRFIQALKELGCRFSLDDFGSGMSSFAYLKYLPVDCIKIDGSFVKEMLNSDTDRAMVEMIVHMAKVMGKGVVAECVESEELIETLREIGVGYAQGYTIGRPEPFECAYPLIANDGREVA